jgi:hypothetical protein
MRLINIDSLQLEEFVGHDVPPYAILSHTWGADEISFQELRDHNQRIDAGIDTHSTLISLPDRKPGGWRKVADTCWLVRGMYAAEYRIQHVWIDTCCIDKSSSAELQEAINSMFRWYERSKICIAYLSDVKYAGSRHDVDLIGEAVIKSRWFTRGWTLQELLAPPSLYFHDADWNPLKPLHLLAGPISRRTGIDQRYLAKVPDLRTFSAITGQEPIIPTIMSASVAERFCWAAGRETTRIEDRAYSLLGIFDINMPLLYGEGEKAFGRLQEEIMKVNDDPSILAWTDGLAFQQNIFPQAPDAVRPVMLARNPDNFAHFRQLQLKPFEATGHSVRNSRRPYFSVVPRGLHLGFPMVQAIETYGAFQPILLLLGAVREPILDVNRILCKEVIALPLFRLTNDEDRPRNHFSDGDLNRSRSNLCVRMPWAHPQKLPVSFLHEIGEIAFQEVILARPTSREAPTWRLRRILDVSAISPSSGSLCSLTEVYPYPQMASQELLELEREAATRYGSGIAELLKLAAAETARDPMERGSRHRFIACGQCEPGDFCSGSVFYRLELSGSERIFAVAISFKFPGGRSATAPCSSTVRVFRVADKNRAVPFAELFWDFARATPGLSDHEVQKLALSEIMPIDGPSPFESVMSMNRLGASQKDRLAMKFDLSQPGLPRVLTIFTKTVWLGSEVHEYLLRCDPK